MPSLSRLAANGLVGLLRPSSWFSCQRRVCRRPDPGSIVLRGEPLEQRLPLAIDLGGHPVFAPGTSVAYMEEFHTQEFNLGPSGTGDGSGFAERWTRTATDGGGLGQGDPTVVTWSIVRDGGDISGGTSDLVSFLAGTYGQTDSDDDFTEEPWFDALQAGFDRWSAVSALELVYEAADDGVASSGVLGVRGDIRVGGRLIDGDSGTLGFNAFPNGGDMVLDTGDSFFSNTSSNSIRLRNVVGHELGHGLGFAHVESSDATFLMEPTIRLSFDGPQFDDILAVQRAYGDVNEENGGNDTTQTATQLGSIPHGTTFSIGTSARDSTTQVNLADVDFVGIDDDSDLDVFGFSVPARSQVTLTLMPKGPTYREGQQGGSQSTFNAKSLSDLQLELIDSNGNTVLRSVDANGIGQDEVISSASLPVAGTFFARVSGAQNQVQMYRLDISVERTPDVNSDPEARDDSASTTAGSAVTINVLANDTDADGDTLSVQSLTQGVNGTASINADGTVRYLPNAGFGGSDSFTYVVSDGLGGTDSASVNVSVTPLNNPPIARNDTSVSDEGTAVSIDVLNNDTDSDGDPLTIQSVTQASGGTVTINANGTLRYSPNAGFSGPDAFAYTIADGRGGTDTATVSIRVNALGRDDIVALADNMLYVARSTGDAFVTNSLGSTDTIWTDVRTGDVNGDAIDDLVGRSGDTLWVARSTGQTFEIETWGLWSDRTSWSFFDLADVDGDGAADVVGRTRGGDWWVGRSTGISFVNQDWGAWSSRVDWQDVNAADVNGDGRTDMVGRANGRWWVAVSNGTSFTNEAWGAWSRRAVWENVRVADVDGNGTDDIIGMTRGQWWIARSTGASFVNEFWGSWSRKVEWVDVRVGDFDGDGLEDVAGRADGRWWIARSTGSSFVNEQWARWSNAVVWVDVMVADFDGDGRHDIAGRTNGRWWVAQSTGVSFANQLWERWSVSEAWRDVMTGEFAV